MNDTRTPQTPLSERELQMQPTLIGIYPGIVESTTDPKTLGRCKVRVATVHGLEDQTSTNALPWARGCFPSFFYNPPQVGDQVWVMFQQGDSKYPVYLGWVPAIPEEAQTRQRHPGYPSHEYDGDAVDGEPLTRLEPREAVLTNQPFAGDEPAGSNEESYVTPAGVPETPPEVRKGRSFDPNVRIFKTWRGHTIEFSDHPEAEYLKVIDRSGQMIMFDCAVDFEEDKKNKTPRGGSIENCFVKGIGEADRQVHNGRTQLPIDKMRQREGENRRASVRLTDLFGQYLELWAEKDRSRIRIQSSRRKDDDLTPNHYFEISSSQDPEQEYLILRSREGHEILIDETKNEIVIRHKEGSIMTIDPSANIRLSTVV